MFIREVRPPVSVTIRARILDEVDGARINSARFFSDREPGEIVRLDHLVPLAQVEVIEIYRRASEIPGELGGSGAQCAVIAVWTRRGR